MMASLYHSGSLSFTDVWGERGQGWPVERCPKMHGYITCTCKRRRRERLRLLLLEEFRMVVASFIVAALLQVAPPTAASDDTVPATNTDVRATTAPADSASVVARHRRETSMDARLVPGWNRVAVADTNPRRRKAVEYSDEYYSRLQMHRVGSWLEFPIFGAEYWLGQKLISPGESTA